MAPDSLGSYRLTPRARADLEDIWLYTAEHWSPDQANIYVDDLVQSFEALVGMPLIARERDEFDPPVRLHPSGRHLIVYRLVEDHIEIVRVLGGRQDWAAILQALDP